MQEDDLEMFFGVKKNGKILVVEQGDLEDVLGDDIGDEYTVTIIYLTRKEYSDIPDFDGF